MKYLIFSLLIGLISCGESLETDVFIERKKEVDNVVISGKIQNGAGLEISLEAPLLQSRGTKVQVVKGIIDKNNSFTLNTQIPGLGYYILKLNSKSSDSLELTLKNGDHLSLNTSISEFTTKPNYSGVSWAEDANMYQQILNAPLSKENLSSYAFKRMKENPVNPFNIIHSMHLMNDENEYNESRIQLFFEVANAFYSYYPGSEPSNNFQKQTVFLRKYMENNAFYDVPEISLKTPDNKTLNLSSVKGKYVLVDFWAS